MPNPRLAKIKALMQEKKAHIVRSKPTFWKPVRLIQRIQPTAKILSWLMTKESLTARIRQHCPDMQVIVLSEQIERPLLDESNALNLQENEQAWVRCVLLKCANKNWVYARTIIPNPIPENPWSHLQQLGDKPLGEVLFELPNVKRTEFEFCAQSLKSWPHLAAHFDMQTLQSKGFARRSCFTQQQATLLLTEVFLPELI